MGRKPVLWMDDSGESTRATQLLNEAGIEYIGHSISELEESCCGGPPSIGVPALYATEGVFRNLEEIMDYISCIRQASGRPSERESAFW